MDQPQAGHQTPGLSSPDVSAEARQAPPHAAPRRRPARRGSLVVAFVASLIALAALGAAVWSYTETRRDILRLSTDIAQLRLSLELYARTLTTPAGTPAGDADRLDDLANRLAILEQAWRAAPSAAPAPTATTPATAAPGAECLPVGMRLLVAAGDRYPVCASSASVDIAGVDNGYVALADGTTIPSGGTMPLGDSGCMIGVTSSGDEGLTGYAEIRVTC